MKVVSSSRGEYADVINSYYNLEAHSQDNEESVLFQGYAASTSESLKNEHSQYKNRIYINLESPCAFCSTTSFEAESKYFTHTYTI